MGSLNKFLKGYVRKNQSRFHMPGHKGNGKFLKNLDFKRDITEIEGADYLHKSRGIIDDLEQRIGNIYGSMAIITTAGATSTVFTALSLIPKDAQLIALRDSHVSFFNGCALLLLEPEIVMGLDEAESYIKKTNKVCYLFITSPDYYGRVMDIETISKVLHDYGGKLIVDNSHGSHLKFLDPDIHPITLGADIVCDSFHKTLPVLTSGAVLHTKKGLFTKDVLKYKLSLFASTSPSYLVMDSIDLAVDWLEKRGLKEFKKLQKRVEFIRKSFNIKFLSTEPAKLTIDCRSVGMDGKQLSEYLEKYGIIPEMHNKRYLTLIVLPFNSNGDFYKLKKALTKLKSKNKSETLEQENSLECRPDRLISIREATFSNFERIPLDELDTKIAARTVYNFPPGTPIIIAGEKYDSYIVKIMKDCGHFYGYVVK